MIAIESGARVVAVAAVHIDVMGWDDGDDRLFERTQREIEAYVLDACLYGLSRTEIEEDLQERFRGRLSDLEFQYVTTSRGDLKAVISADAVVEA